MLVDPDILRAFAAQVQTASSTIAAADVGTKVTTAADGLPASTTQWACRLIGAHVAQVAAEIAKNVNDMGAAVRGAGAKYEVTDDALAGSFDGLF